MPDHWMPSLQLYLDADTARQVPRNPAYRYYHDGLVLHIGPRPRYYHALLDLDGFRLEAPAGVAPRVRPLRPRDWPALAPVFADAFRDQQPFIGLDETTRLEAAEHCLLQTRLGIEGPLIDPACLVFEDDRVQGAALVTLLPGGSLLSHDSYYWDAPPPADAVQRRLGRPHLTWVFVARDRSRLGLGTVLLAAAVEGLRELGYRELASTFLLGNHASALWHWRCGFRLLPHLDHLPPDEGPR